MQLKQIDARLFQIRSELNYQQYLTPSNFTLENERFLHYYNRNIVYQPQYRYTKFVLKDGIYRELEECLLHLRKYHCEKGMGNVLLQAALSLKKEIMMYDSIGCDERFTSLSNEIYGLPNQAYLPLAKEILDNTHSENGKQDVRYDAEYLANCIAKRLKTYGLCWNIVCSDKMASRISVEPDERCVYINKNARFTLNDTVRLLVHEIDTHVLRCENGQNNGYHILASGTPGSLIHEEGLALYNEWKNNVQDPLTLRLYAARFITCCNMGQGFYELFDSLVKCGCNTEQAMYVVSRIKRGLSDTAKPGGFIKDYVYFQGFFEIKTFIEQHAEYYPHLYYGSISIQDLDLLKNEIDVVLVNGMMLLPGKG